MSESQQADANNELSATTQPRSLGWLKGFKDIITNPSSSTALDGAHAIKIAFASVLLYGFAFTISAWIVWTHVGLREQSYQVTTYILKLSGQQIPEPAQTFQFANVLGSAALQNGLLGLLFTTMLFWAVHRLFTQQGLSFALVLGIVAFSNSITAVGFVLTSLLQLITGNVGAGFSLGVFFHFSEHYFMSSFLTRIDVFLFWQYVAIATVIETLLRGPKVRLLIALISLLLYTIYIGSMTWWSYQLFLGAVK